MSVTLRMLALATLTGIGVCGRAEQIGYDVLYQRRSFDLGFLNVSAGSPYSGTTIINAQFGVPKFDASLGTLTRVYAGYQTEIQPYFQCSIPGSPPTQPVDVMASLTARFKMTPPGAPPIDAEMIFTDSGAFAPQQSTLFLSYSEQSVDTRFVALPDASTDLFVGTGLVILPLRVELVEQVSMSAGSMYGIFDFEIEGVVSVLYEYDPLRQPGDANGDLLVTGADFTIWSDNFDEVVGGKTWEQGDWTGDGFVTGADFMIWADNFGHGPATAVPEPGGMFYTLALAAAVATRLRTAASAPRPARGNRARRTSRD